MADTLSKVRLLDVCDFISGNAHEQHISALGQYTVINSKFVSTEGKVAKFAIENFCPAKKDDITLVMSDLPNGKALGKCFLVPEDKKYAVNQRVCILRSKGFDPKYLFYILNRNPYFLSFNDGVSQTHLLNSVFEKCYITVTEDIAEQKAIAKSLSDIDEIIVQISEQLIKQSNLFISVSEKLLNPQNNTGLIFEPYSLGKLGNTFGGLNGKSGKDFGTGSEYVTFLNVMNNLVLNPATVDYVEISPGEIQNRLQENDLVFNGSSETPEEAGLTSVVPKNLEGAYLNSFCFGFRFSKIEEIDPKYFAFLSRSSVGRRIMGLLAQGSTRYNISKTELLKVQWPIPSIDIQINTVKILSDILSLIENTKLAKAKYECIKQGMAQDLLTGKVRLV